MKKLLIIALFAAIASAATAQITVKAIPLTTTSYSNALDTVTNTGTKGTNAIKAPNWRTGVTAQVVVTKISGTVGGTLSLQGSMDGTNWSTIGSASTPSDASANYSFNSTAAWYYYRLYWAGTGTMSASFKSFILFY
jgi:hypothetical protein